MPGSGNILALCTGEQGQDIQCLYRGGVFTRKSLSNCLPSVLGIHRHQAITVVKTILLSIATSGKKINIRVTLHEDNCISHHRQFNCSSNSLFSNGNTQTLHHCPCGKGNHRLSVGSHHKGPVIWKVFTLRDVILIWIIIANNLHLTFAIYLVSTAIALVVSDYIPLC